MSNVSPTSLGSFPAATVPPATFTLKEYEHYVDCGAFAGKGKRNIELLWGVLAEKSPVAPEHSDSVDRLSAWSVRATLDEPIRVRIQNPIRLPSSDSEPEPDVCWVRKRDYSKQHPGPEDILLIIEVADSSVERDRVAKLAGYAQAGIPDYWIVNLVEHQVEVYRQPKDLEYIEKRILKDQEAVAPLALPAAQITARQLLAKSAT